jgi:hypothetical protein
VSGGAKAANKIPSHPHRRDPIFAVPPRDAVRPNEISRNEKARAQSVALENWGRNCRVSPIAIVECDCQCRADIGAALQPVEQRSQRDDIEESREEPNEGLEFSPGAGDWIVRIIVSHPVEYNNGCTASQQGAMQTRPEDDPAYKSFDPRGQRATDCVEHYRHCRDKPVPGLAELTSECGANEKTRLCGMLRMPYIRRELYGRCLNGNIPLAAASSYERKGPADLGLDSLLGPKKRANT